MSLNFMLKISCLAKRSLHSKIKVPLYNVYYVPSKLDIPSKIIYGNTKLFKNNLEIKPRTSQFHVSSPRNALPPLFVIAVRTIAKLGAILSGRIIRKWWQKLPPEEKKIILDKIRSKKSKIAGVGTIFMGALYLYYLENLTEDPITKRKRFIILNQKQLYQIADFEYRHQLSTFKSNIIPPSHPIHRRVARVANNLLLSNSDLTQIRDKVWSVTVVDRPDITNAFALPHGKIFVFTGMLNFCTNDDQLAIVLAHEISHSILFHVAESMSKIFFVEFILLIPTIIFWTVFSDAWALFSEWITANLAKIFVHLPFSRSIEREADLIGLQLAAKSCYDVREAPVFWAKMKILSEDAVVEWLSTHPRHETRQTELQQLLPEALRIREINRCPPLYPKIRFF